MSLIPDRTLDSLTAADLPPLEGVSPEEVREIRRTPTEIQARVAQARVSISADLEESCCTACPDGLCPHVRAVLAAWVRRRVPVKRPRRLGLVDRLLSGPGWKDADDFLSDFLRGGAGTADLRPDGSIVVHLTRGPRSATIHVPTDEAPSFLWNLPRGIVKTEALKAARISRRPLAPELRADYDSQGRLVLQPTWEGGIVPREGARWHFDGKVWHPLGTAPRDLRSYFKGPRTLDEEKIPEFLENELRKLLRHSVFKPSAAVKESRLVPRLRLAGLRVRSVAGDWLDLEPVYAAGDLRLAMSEILAVQGRRPYLRKGNTWIPTASLEPYPGPLRTRRAELLLRRPEVPVEGIDLPDFDPAANDPPPRGFLSELRPYQMTGYHWMRYLRRAGLHGVLADDMGLGKTHQAMAFLLSLYEEGAGRPSLVVTPTSVLDPWIEKIRAFAPALRPYRYYGPDRKPEILRLPGQRLIVTTYTVLARDVAPLSAIDWECVILDEAQYIKTASTQFAQAAKQLRAATRLALTGTPIENRLDELWSIFDFLLPGHLGSRERFREEFEIPILRRNDSKARERLKARIAPFKLRRLKGEVLQDLPPKVEDLRLCELSPHQEALYRTIVQRDGESLAAELRDTARQIDYVSIFSTLSRLKMVCDHPALVVEGPRARELSSGKFEVFCELLEEALSGGHKVVVFTQYLRMMDIIEDHLRSRRIGYAELRGNTRDRSETMRAFHRREDCRVFVCSLLAGGVGIDLTSASVVIHYDRWWNAAREDQATDRVHRWGQRRGVQVFKLVTRGTLEEKIDRMIAAKGDLMNSIVEVDAGSFRRFSREELIELLTGTGPTAPAATAVSA